MKTSNSDVPPENPWHQVMDETASCSPEASETQSSNGITPFLFFLGLIALFLYLIFWLNRQFPATDSDHRTGQIIVQVILVFWISRSLVWGDWRRHLRHAMIWTGIGCILLTGYSFRPELMQIWHRVQGVLMPSKGVSVSTSALHYQRSSDGHFHIRARANRVWVDFLVDTGASHITLSPDDARRLGFNLDQLTYDRIYQTANGTVRGSRIRLDQLQVGDHLFRDIPASVNGATMDGSLLGIDFFDRFSRYSVEGEVLTLEW